MVSRAGPGGGASDRPIPPLDEPTGWRGVAARECGEPLVALTDYAPDRIAVDARYHAAGYPGALPDCYARVGVARRLAAAAALLPAGWRLVVFDAWRPQTVQRHLFDRYLADLRREQPEASDAALRALAARYVAPPSADAAHPSPHATGGVVDLSLLDASGALVPMGTAFDAFEARAYTRYFEERREADEPLTLAEEGCLRNRRILFHALRRVGFTNYPAEWWHYEYGGSRYGPLCGLEDWQAAGERQG
ncbi:MAG TPA: M15 family metallopeptidase [Chloroflexota bacterium]|nr:M15 family metallopeptidase [Chloroflexota bacterium]